MYRKQAHLHALLAFSSAGSSQRLHARVGWHQVGTAWGKEADELRGGSQPHLVPRRLEGEGGNQASPQSSTFLPLPPETLVFVSKGTYSCFPLTVLHVTES